jgi:hypothetical protein
LERNNNASDEEDRRTDDIGTSSSPLTVRLNLLRIIRTAKKIYQQDAARDSYDRESLARVEKKDRERGGTILRG